MCRKVCVIIFLLISIATGTLPGQTGCHTPQQRVLVVGDSWAALMWLYGSYRQAFDKFGYADIIDKGDVTAIGGTRASDWVQPAYYSRIISELANHPQIDIVVISIGGNDLLGNWSADMLWFKEDMLYDQIENDIQTLINIIKLAKPGIKIVFSGYDYLNLVETRMYPGSPYQALYQNLGEPTVEELNEAFVRLEQIKIDMAIADPQVFYVNSMGLMQYIYGYPTLLPVWPYLTFPPASVPFPGQANTFYNPFPGGLIMYPTPPVALGLNGQDAIHLSEEGYQYLAENQTRFFFWDQFHPVPDMVFYSQGGQYDGWASSTGQIGYGQIKAGSNYAGEEYRAILTFDTSPLPDDALVTRASIFITRQSLSGTNPFTSNLLGNPVVEIKHGAFGNPWVEAGDFNQPADFSDAGCITGTASKDMYRLRIDLKSDALRYIHNAGVTQFRLKFQSPVAQEAWMTFYAGGSANAPFIDMDYTPATHVYRYICLGDSIWLEGRYRNQPGIYIDTLLSSSGTDSLVVTHLSVYPFEVSIQPVDTACAGSDGATISAVVTGGVQPLHYAWSTGHTAPVLRHIGQGTYQLSVTDNNGCVRRGQITLSDRRLDIFTTHVTPVSARLNWQPYPGAAAYIIRGKAVHSATWTYLAIHDSTRTYRVVNGLQNGKTYIWQARAFCTLTDTLGTPWSRIDSFTTGCGEVDSLWTGPLAPDAARLNWKAVDGAVGYEIHGGRAGASNRVVLLVPDGLQTSRNIYGLQPATAYWWKIRALCLQGAVASAWSARDTFTTPSGSRMAPQAPGAFSGEYPVLRCHPNPFYATTCIEVVLPPRYATAVLQLTDITGKVWLQQTIGRLPQQAGHHGLQQQEGVVKRIFKTPRYLPEGLYFVRLVTMEHNVMVQMKLLKAGP